MGKMNSRMCFDAYSMIHVCSGKNRALESKGCRLVEGCLRKLVTYQPAYCFAVRISCRIPQKPRNLGNEKMSDQSVITPSLLHHQRIIQNVLISAVFVPRLHARTRVLNSTSLTLWLLRASSSKTLLIADSKKRHSQYCLLAYGSHSATWGTCHTPSVAAM